MADRVELFRNREFSDDWFMEANAPFELDGYCESRFFIPADSVTGGVERARALRSLAQWLVALDEPESTERRTVTMTQIIEQARAALEVSPSGGVERWRDREEELIHDEAVALARVAAFESVGERLLSMTINGVLCQDDEDACRLCKAMWKDLRELLDGSVAESLGVTDDRG